MDREAGNKLIAHQTQQQQHIVTTVATIVSTQTEILHNQSTKQQLWQNKHLKIK